MEKFGAFILVVACLFMACLNLWNLFKEWFDSKYQPGNENKDSSPERAGEQNDGIDKHIYIYKDKLKDKDKGMNVKTMSRFCLLIWIRKNGLKKKRFFWKRPQGEKSIPKASIAVRQWMNLNWLLKRSGESL
ncbi:hypothetical protein EZS27_028721 [termite gut metagenome]|uniref:Uncharacterized protein n=1 Tax=termite gut metagenome TaxID=433724 RepID=A0A5J4QJP2_9ZZZZ